MLPTTFQSTVSLSTCLLFLSYSPWEDGPASKYMGYALEGIAWGIWQETEKTCKAKRLEKYSVHATKLRSLMNTFSKSLFVETRHVAVVFVQWVEHFCAT